MLWPYSQPDDITLFSPRQYNKFKIRVLEKGQKNNEGMRRPGWSRKDPTFTRVNLDTEMYRECHRSKKVKIRAMNFQKDPESTSSNP